MSKYCDYPQQDDEAEHILLPDDDWKAEDYADLISEYEDKTDG